MTWRGGSPAEQHPTDEQLAEYLDGGMSEPDAARIEAHLESCARCEQVLEGFGSMSALLRSLPQYAAPRPFTIDELSARRKAPPIWSAYASLAASLVLALGMFVALASSGGPAGDPTAVMSGSESNAAVITPALAADNDIPTAGQPAEGDPELGPSAIGEDTGTQPTPGAGYTTQSEPGSAATTGATGAASAEMLVTQAPGHEVPTGATSPRRAATQPTTGAEGAGTTESTDSPESAVPDLSSAPAPTAAAATSGRKDTKSTRVPHRIGTAGPAAGSTVPPPSARKTERPKRTATRLAVTPTGAFTGRTFEPTAAAQSPSGAGAGRDGEEVSARSSESADGSRSLAWVLGGLSLGSLALSILLFAMRRGAWSLRSSRSRQ